MKNDKKNRIIEFFIVFFAFIFPTYLSQDLGIDPLIFSNLRFNITYIVTTLPYIALLLYILYLGNKKAFSLKQSIGPYGFIDIDSSIIWKVGIVFIGTLSLALVGSLAYLLPFVKSSELFQTVPWEISDVRILPVVLITCMATGYYEELLFRSYCITRFQDFGLPKLPAIVISAVLFAAGHIYQGLLAFFVTFSIGLFLGAMFVRFKNIHMLAIGHGLYNFFSLILFPFISNFLI